jgi:uncharacterized membrane protein YhaH (DUF805 family)/type II secretory pathway pseudopilin PulG
MKQCPGCRRNLADSAVTCPFCRRSVDEGAPPVRPGELPSLTRGPLAEPHTLNWFVLLRRCLSTSGRFSRSQFAVAYVGTLALFWTVAIAAVLGLEAAGMKEDTASTVGGLVILAMVPVVMVAAIGGSIRRWHDLGHSGWMVLLNLVPCVGAFVILYLLFAPGLPEGNAPVESTPVLAIVAGVFLFGVCGVGMISAIAIPSLLRARVSANESAAIGDIRTVISAQAAYQAANGGLYEGNLECLAAPYAGCVPGYPAHGPTFLDPVLVARQPKSGYERRFEPGRMVEVDPAVSSPTSVAEYAYVATPVKAGQTGVRSFCGDSTGLVCFRADGADIHVLGGVCPGSAQGCTPFQ